MVSIDKIDIMCAMQFSITLRKYRQLKGGMVEKNDLYSNPYFGNAFVHV